MSTNDKGGEKREWM